MAKDNSRDAPSHHGADLRPIGAVVGELQHLYPEISVSSLRFLEREGLMEPHRSPGGHRLYSDADIQRIRQIKEWQARRLSLAEIRSRLRERSGALSATDLRERVLALYLNGRTRDAQAMLLSHDVDHLDLETMFGDVLTPILIEVGARWETGDFEISQEKETSESIREVVVELSLRHRAAEAHGPVIVAATVLGELHELGLRMVCGVLGAAGYRVVYLGANAAPEHVAQSVRRHQPAAVLLSTGSADNFPAVKATIDTIGALRPSPSPRLLVGGAGVPGHEAAITSMGASPVSEGGLTRFPAELGRLIS